MENKIVENDRTLSYKMSYKLTEEDLNSNNVSASGTSCQQVTASGNGNQGTVSYTRLNNDD